MGSTPALKLVRAIDSGGMRTAHVCVDGWILGGFVPVNSLPESPMQAGDFEKSRFANP